MRPKCHPRKPHHAKGLCHTCYMRELLRQPKHKERTRKYDQRPERKRAHSARGYRRRAARTEKEKAAYQEEMRIYLKKWRKDPKNYWRFKASQSRSIARNKYDAKGDTNAYQLEQRFKFYQMRCAYCGKAEKSLQIDHVIPLSRGGTHWPANIRPICSKCNPSKGDMKLQEWKSLAPARTHYKRGSIRATLVQALREIDRLKTILDQACIGY